MYVYGNWHRVLYYEFTYTLQERAMYMPVHEGSTFLQSDGRLLPNYTVLHVRRRYSSRSPHCELQNLVCSFTLRHQMEAKSRCEHTAKYVLRKCDKVQTIEIAPKQSILHSKLEETNFGDCSHSVEDVSLLVSCLKP